ncbi:MAG TPA: Rv3235 family protein [Cellulomonas sp.]
MSAPTTLRLVPVRPRSRRPASVPDGILPVQRSRVASAPPAASTRTLPAPRPPTAAGPQPGRQPDRDPTPYLGPTEHERCPLDIDPLDRTSADAATAAPALGLSVDPDHASAIVAVAAVEVLAGDRQQAQLARWLLPEVYDTLRRRAVLSAHRPVTAPDHARCTEPAELVGGLVAATGLRPVVRRLRMCRIDANTVESSVVVSHAHRVRAVAVRLVRLHGRWRASALEIG